MSSYVTPMNEPQTLTVAFSDFSKNLVGGSYDMKHVKDLTLVNMGPVGTVFTFTKITLLGNCAILNATMTEKAAAASLSSTVATSSSAVTESASSKLATGNTTSPSLKSKGDHAKTITDRMIALVGLISVFAMLL
ncbi:hypothetical protein HDU76_000048 [Blyttiomyces sp. JEL0837]|nr:hypothetical protein HDU76_000048 [Blyttiomyces sp. JEL0837]